MLRARCSLQWYLKSFARDCKSARVVALPHGDRNRELPNFAALAITASFASILAWRKQATVSCEEAVDIPIMTYNVLSPALARPSHYKLNDPADLDVNTRYAHIQARLDVAIAVGTVIALQEVDLGWAGKLHAYLAERGYAAVFAQYGSDFSNYMGVMVAWPVAKYEAKKIEIVRLSDTVPKETWPKSKGRPASPTGTLSSYEVKQITGAYPPSSEADFDEWDIAKRRRNEAIYVKLKPRSAEGSARSFAICNYHMPCLFGTAPKVRVMNIHLYFLIRYLRKFSDGDPCVLLGDFNIKPPDSPYRLASEGGNLKALSSTWPSEVEGLLERLPADVPFPNGLQSAYKTFHGSEPLFTNYAQTSAAEGAFCETLDYIWFTSGDFEVMRCPPMPHSRADVRGPFPSVQEPSDHMPLIATLRAC